MEGAPSDDQGSARERSVSFDKLIARHVAEDEQIANIQRLISVRARGTHTIGVRTGAILTLGESPMRFFCLQAGRQCQEAAGVAKRQRAHS